MKTTGLKKTSLDNIIRISVMESVRNSTGYSIWNSIDDSIVSDVSDFVFKSLWTPVWISVQRTNGRYVASSIRSNLKFRK
jgi:hypothetical protein